MIAPLANKYVKQLETARQHADPYLHHNLWDLLTRTKLLQMKCTSVNTAASVQTDMIASNKQDSSRLLCQQHAAQLGLYLRPWPSSCLPLQQPLFCQQLSCSLSPSLQVSSWGPAMSYRQLFNIWHNIVQTHFTRSSTRWPMMRHLGNMTGHDRRI